ncbi:MAG: class I adenylate-forming enzyme family protein [Actinomycetota bacterium]
MNLSAFIIDSACKYPDNTCVVHDSNRFTYFEIDRLSDILANTLIENGLRKGERVVILLENSAEYIISFFAILKTCGVAVPLNTQLVSRELSYLLNDCSPKLIITNSQHQSTLKSLTNPKSILLIDKLNLNKKSIPETYNLEPISGNDTDLAMIIYTSGTTGNPKGVMLSHQNLCANADSIIEYLQPSASDKIMVVLPFYYSYGTSLLTTHIKVGGTLVIDNRFLYPNVVLDTMKKEQVTGFAGVPSNYIILLRKSALRKYKLNNLRYVTQAGGAMSPAMIQEFIKTIPHIKFYVMYGQTEATARLAYLATEFLENKLGSIGKAIPGVELDILNEQNQRVKTGETGEIVARGANIMLGYWNSPEETAGVLTKEGLRTGDLAYKDEDGFIYLVARKKEMIKSGANRISPLEIEEVACQMPGVLECAAVGIPDEILGETIGLYVVKSSINLSKNDLLLFCKQNLAAFKMPKVVEFVESLPKTSTGKIKRLALTGDLQ